jgi:hypothetical protein
VEPNEDWRAIVDLSDRQADVLFTVGSLENVHRKLPISRREARGCSVLDCIHSGFPSVFRA